MARARGPAERARVASPLVKLSSREPTQSTGRRSRRTVGTRSSRPFWSCSAERVTTVATSSGCRAAAITTARAPRPAPTSATRRAPSRRAQRAAAATAASGVPLAYSNMTLRAPRRASPRASGSHGHGPVPPSLAKTTAVVPRPSSAAFNASPLNGIRAIRNPAGARGQASTPRTSASAVTGGSDGRRSDPSPDPQPPPTTASATPPNTGRAARAYAHVRGHPDHGVRR